LSDAKDVPTANGASNDGTSKLDELEGRIEAFEAAYARDLGAVVHALTAAEFLRGAAREALCAYSEAHRCADADYQATCESLRHKEAAASGGSFGGEQLPLYLLAAERIRVERVGERLRECETRLGAVRRRSADADAEAALLAERLDMLRQERDQRLAELRQQRVALLKARSSAPPARPPNVRTSVEDVWDDLPAMHGAASPGRECQRCGEPVPRGRKRFCSRECCRLYLEENGSLENPKRSRFYDYGSHDPEDERWDDPTGV